MNFESIETPHLSLRKFDPDILRILFSDPSGQIQGDYFGNSERLIQKEKSRYEQGNAGFRRSFAYFYIFLKSETQPIGWCGYHTIYLDHHRAEIGYELFDEGNRGKGFMSEAIDHILKYGFEELGLHRIEALVGKNNDPSIRIVESRGFEKEGLLREHYLINGVFEDSLVYGLIKT